MLPFVQKVSGMQGDLFYTTFSASSHHEMICNILSEAISQKVNYNDIPINDSGRPDLSSWGIDANWTHSHNTCVLVYSFNANVGVDLEFYKKRSNNLAKRFFHLEEIQAILDLQDPFLSEQLFYRLWSRKEAFYKCFGGSFFKDVLPRSMLQEEETFSFIEPSLGKLEEDRPYSFCIVASLKQNSTK